MKRNLLLVSDGINSHYAMLQDVLYSKMQQGRKNKVCGFLAQHFSPLMCTDDFLHIWVCATYFGTELMQRCVCKRRYYSVFSRPLQQND